MIFLDISSIVSCTGDGNLYVVTTDLGKMHFLMLKFAFDFVGEFVNLGATLVLLLVPYKSIGLVKYRFFVHVLEGKIISFMLLTSFV